MSLCVVLLLQRPLVDTCCVLSYHTFVAVIVCLVGLRDLLTVHYRGPLLNCTYVASRFHQDKLWQQNTYFL